MILKVDTGRKPHQELSQKTYLCRVVLNMLSGRKAVRAIGMLIPDFYFIYSWAYCFFRRI